MEAVQHPHPGPWVPDHTTFRARLALIRNHLGAWNVAKTATACGIDAQTWRNWEKGGSVHGFDDQTRKIAEAVGCDLIWLRSGDPSHGTLSVTDRELLIDLTFEEQLELVFDRPALKLVR